MLSFGCGDSEVYRRQGDEPKTPTFAADVSKQSTDPGAGCRKAAVLREVLHFRSATCTTV